MGSLFLAAILLCGQAPPPLRFEATPSGDRVVARLPVEIANRLPGGRLTPEQGEAVLTVSLLSDKTAGPSMLGRYERSGHELMFMPRFPFNAGAAYRATLRTGASAVSLDYRVPTPAATAPPRLIKIYPTADVLPANHLRFYIYFDRPMRGGKELFKHLAILDEMGKEIEEPWLVDEIWDEANNCLILYIHPGRIKWGLDLRESMGPVLHEKRSYTLVVRGAWTDLQGNKLGTDTIQKFRTTAEDRARIELSACRLTAPTAGLRDSLTLTFPRSIDHRSLQTGLTVTDAAGRRLAGTIAIGKHEKTWSFTPAQPWQPGRHRVNIDRDLEDSAGNTPARPFDMDLTAPVPAPQNFHLDFQPR